MPENTISGKILLENGTYFPELQRKKMQRQGRTVTSNVKGKWFLNEVTPMTVDMRSKLVLGSLALLVAPALASAQQVPPVEPNQLVRQMVQNELHPTDGGHQFMYKDTTVYKNRSVTKEVVRTPQGPLERTLAIDGGPLSPDQRAKEDAKLQKFANDADARRKKQQSDKEEGQREDLMVKTLPDAFLYTYVGTGRGPNGRDLVHLQFKPNPAFDPPNHETQVYLGMQGDMYIDLAAERLVKMDGALFKDVNFGWGILGRLYKGGKFIIKQADIGSGVWEETEEILQFNGKVLLVKPLQIDSRETRTDFRPVPSQVTTAQALDLLHKSDQVVAENGGGARAPNPK